MSIENLQLRTIFDLIKTEQNRQYEIMLDNRALELYKMWEVPMAKSNKFIEVLYTDNTRASILVSSIVRVQEINPAQWGENGHHQSSQIFYHHPCEYMFSANTYTEIMEKLNNVKT